VVEVVREVQAGQADGLLDRDNQPSLDKKQIQTLSSCHFIEHGENVVFLGPPGVGKSHLAVGLGLKAIEHGYRVLFTTAVQGDTGGGLADRETRARREGLWNF
jgi:ATP:corrinoid adenosyltransferase